MGVFEKGASLRSKMGRKKKVKHDPHLSSHREKGQLSLEESQKREWQEKLQWKGGLTARKNLPEEFDDEKS